jgi:hypothetical protein
LKDLSSPEKDETANINLERVIALSKQTDYMFNINKTFSADLHASESQVLAIQNRSNSSMLSEIELQKLESKEEMKFEKRSKEDLIET